MTDISDRNNSQRFSDTGGNFLNSLAELKLQFDLQDLEYSNLTKPITLDFYEKWLAQNYHGSMSYLANHFDRKTHIKEIHPDLKGVISVAQSYFPAKAQLPIAVPARTALYAQNQDYHIWFKDRLVTLCEKLKQLYPNELFMPYVDTGPILERDFAYQNRLGWFGKNTCLINRQHGSFFFIGEILSTIEIQKPTQDPLPDHCGTCTACIDICPTNALVAPKEMKADRCVSYFTIESKSIPPEEVRPKLGDWFFGCDLCQTVCPWNQKVFRNSQTEKNQKQLSIEQSLSLDECEKADLISYFRFLLTESNKKIEKYHADSPLLRARPKGLKRNALIVIANRKMIELKPEVEGMLSSDLKELARWTLTQLS